MHFRYQNIRAPEENACTAGQPRSKNKNGPGETLSWRNVPSEEERRQTAVFDPKIVTKIFFFLVDGQKAKKLQMSHDKKDGK